MYSTDEQKHYLNALNAAYAKRTQASQQRREATWPALADARSSQGFFAQMPPAAKQIWLATKQLRHPIVAERAAGARVWDIDGNEYVDYCLGFGVHLFGHKPGFLDEALRQQLDRGMPIGYQSDRANEVAKTIAMLTNAERVALCNTGAEAIMGAVRLARAATKRDKIAVFSGSYHGSYDAALPAMNMNLGLSSSQKNDVFVLDYGSSRSLELIAENAGQIACVLVEPVQARNLQLQPLAFLRELRSLTRNKDIALIFDDILVGF
ncbi:MAG TPA: aminotransferase class III-fold pyridoxal phosphate-dependent enzyme, partial [Polyangium sp.]|nr:aminotransferase class III-fold pyridoxal phosphate-dependent enzyme [Polyangium sp.]